MTPEPIVTDPIVYVIDDDDAVRNSLTFLLDCAGLATRAFPSADAFLQADPPLETACIITDVRMPGLSGVELAQRLQARGALAPVIMITGHADVPMAIQAMKAGVTEFIEKPFADDVLIEAARSAVSRHQNLQAAAAERAGIRERLASLTPRETDVLQGLAAGHANKVIAHDLDISARTVEVYRANLMTKLGARSLSDVIRMVTVAQTATD